MATCYDDPTEVFDSQRCLDAVSKDVKGTVRISAKHSALCEARKCTTFHTVGLLKLATTNHKPCDSKLSLKLATGTFAVKSLATSYDTDGLQRGVHAGDFSWSSPARMSQSKAGCPGSPTRGSCARRCSRTNARPARLRGS